MADVNLEFLEFKVNTQELDIKRLEMQVFCLGLVRQLDSAALDCLYQLFCHGPTWDGDICSKSGRGDLFEHRLASRSEGFSFLTESGIKLALYLKMDRRKDQYFEQVFQALELLRRGKCEGVQAGGPRRLDTCNEESSGQEDSSCG